MVCRSHTIDRDDKLSDIETSSPTGNDRSPESHCKSIGTSLMLKGS